MSPLGTMELIALKPLQKLGPEADREDAAANLGEGRTAGSHIDEAFEAVHTVLDASLNYLLKGRQTEPWVSWATLDVPDKCAVLRRALHLNQDRDAHYLHRMHGHLEAVEHYDRERSRLLRLEFENPGMLTMTEKANIADYMMTAAMQFDEGMICEHDGIRSSLW